MKSEKNFGMENLGLTNNQKFGIMFIEREVNEMVQTMYVSHNEMTVIKMNLLGGMYSFLGQDELAYCEWITLFPDEPSEDDLKDIAEDDELWVSACEAFGKIVKRYRMN